VLSPKIHSQPGPIPKPRDFPMTQPTNTNVLVNLVGNFTKPITIAHSTIKKISIIIKYFFITFRLLNNLYCTNEPVSGLTFKWLVCPNVNFGNAWQHFQRVQDRTSEIIIIIIFSLSRKARYDLAECSSANLEYLANIIKLFFQ